MVLPELWAHSPTQIVLMMVLSVVASHFYSKGASREGN